MSWDPAQSPDQAWQSARELPRGTTESDLAGGGHAVLVQDEPRVRIVLSASGGSGTRQVSKIYRTPLALTWRDLFRYPQAQREYENLQFAFQKKLPVAEPLGFGLRRRVGSDWYSQLTTAFLEGTTLRDVLAQNIAGREELIGMAGRLVATIHRKGMVWGTAHSGNFMVHSGSPATMSAFDFPYAFCTGKDRAGSRLALYDVWNMVVDFRTQCRLDESLVGLFFEAYAAEAGLDTKNLQSRVDARQGKKSVFPERLFIRTVRSFRLRPF
ncbi:lipopolysaccharide kinase InaA family protein [Pseudomonadota bacterium]